MTTLLSLDDDTTVAVRAGSTTSTPASELDQVGAPGETRPGGRIIDTEHDMPALEALLEAHRVKTAVIVVDSSSEMPTVAAPDPSRDWRQRAGFQLDRAASAAASGDYVDEELAFVVMLDDEPLTQFVAHARLVLDRPTTNEQSWELFLRRASRAVELGFGHEPLETPVAEAGDVEPDVSPLFDLSDLSVSFSRGAIGAPRPLHVGSRPAPNV
jgi:hypothetical protein